MLIDLLCTRHYYAYNFYYFITDNTVQSVTLTLDIIQLVHFVLGTLLS